MQKNVDIKNIDANLVLNAQKGDKDALSKLCSIAMQPVYYICVKILQNEADAEDMVSETMITLIQKIQDLKDPSAFYGWIKRIAVNKCNYYLSTRKPVLLGDEETEILENTELEDYNKEFLPEEFAIEKEKREIRMEIIKTKTSKVEMMTLLMFYYNGDSIKTIKVEEKNEDGTYDDEMYDKFEADRDALADCTYVEIDDGDGNIVKLKAK